MIKLHVYVNDNCKVCKRVIKILKEFSNSEPNIQLKIINIKDTDKRVSIVPALFFNDKLYSYGDINMNNLKNKVHQFIRSN